MNMERLSPEAQGGTVAWRAAKGNLKLKRPKAKAAPRPATDHVRGPSPHMAVRREGLTWNASGKQPRAHWGGGGRPLETAGESSGRRNPVKTLFRETHGN